TTLARPAPASPVFDPAGDAQVPHYSPAGAGPNQPQLDFKSVAVNQTDANTLRVRMTVNSLASMLPAPGKASAFWITRFQALSKNDAGTGEAYRIFYVGAESIGGGPPVFFAGSPNRDAGGCTQTSPGNCKVVQYPAEFTTLNGVTGAVSGNTFCIDLPLALFGASRPMGNTLYNVTAFSGGRDNPAADVYAEGDSTAPFDFTLGTTSAAACAAPPEVCVPANVALSSAGATATASSTYVGRSYSPAGAIDGERRGVNWESGGGWNDETRGVWPDWLQVDFSGSKTVSEVRVYSVQDDFRNPQEPTPLMTCSLYCNESFAVQYWDGSNWVTVPGGAVTGNDKVMRVFTFPPVTTSKIRVLVTNGRSYFSRITEVEALGCAAQ
ncbi:MAG TPA: discoidin domain-containing protein, partial [Pyrinomonadaceae bacterium]